MDFVKKNDKAIGIVGCALMGLGSCLTFAKVSFLGVSKGVNFLDGDGVLVLIAAIVALVLFLLEKYKPSLIIAAAGLGITLYDMINVKSKYAQTGYSSLVKLSFGPSPWIIIIGAVLVGLAIFPKVKKD